MANYQTANEKYYDQLREQDFDLPHAVALAQRSVSYQCVRCRYCTNFLSCHSLSCFGDAVSLMRLYIYVPSPVLLGGTRLLDPGRPTVRAAKAFRQAHTFHQETVVMDFACGVGGLGNTIFLIIKLPSVQFILLLLGSQVCCPGNYSPM